MIFVSPTEKITPEGFVLQGPFFCRIVVFFIPFSNMSTIIRDPDGFVHEQHTVEMVDFVLQDDRVKAFGVECDAATVAVDRLHGKFFMTHDDAVFPGYAQASFLAFLHGLGCSDDNRVHQEFYATAQSGDKGADVFSYLRRGNPDSVFRVHGEGESVEECLKLRCGDFGYVNFLRWLAQGWGGLGDDQKGLHRERMRNVT